MKLLQLLLGFHVHLVVFTQLWWLSFSQVHSHLLTRRSSTKIGNTRFEDKPAVLVKDHTGSPRDDENMLMSVDPILLNTHPQHRGLQGDRFMKIVNDVQRVGDDDEPLDMCLEDFSESISDKNVILSPCSDSMSQIWSFDEDGYIRSMRNKCLKAGREGTQGSNILDLSDCQGFDSQRWTDDCGRILSQNNELYIGVRGQCDSIRDSESDLELQDIFFPTEECPSQQMWRFEYEYYDDDQLYSQYPSWSQIDPNTSPNFKFHHSIQTDSADYRVNYGDMSVSCEMDSSWSKTKILLSRGGDLSNEVGTFDARQWKCEDIAMSEDGDTIVASIAEFELETEVNLARFGKATMSSMYSSKTHRQYASNAIDGNTNGTLTFALTDDQSRPWWQVKLSSQSLIRKIVVYNREAYEKCDIDNCVSRLNDSTLSILSEDGSVIVERDIIDSTTGPMEFQFGEGVLGSIVKLQSTKRTNLGVAEVEVYGYGTKSFGKNVALTGIASQSSTWSSYNDGSGSAAYANDGNTENKLSYSITNREYEPWWQVDLLSPSLIKKIIVHNRGAFDACTFDNCVNRLDDSNVVIMDRDGEVVSQRRISDSVNEPLQVFDYEQGIVGFSVKVQSTKTTYLNLAEVEVFGTEIVEDLRTNHTVKLYKKSPTSSTYDEYVGFFNGHSKSSISLSGNGKTIAISTNNAVHTMSRIDGDILLNSDLIPAPLELNTAKFGSKLSMSMDGLLIGILSPDIVRYGMPNAGAITIYYKDADDSKWDQAAKFLYGTRRNNLIGENGFTIRERYRPSGAMALLNLIGDDNKPEKSYIVPIPRSVMMPTSSPTNSTSSFLPSTVPTQQTTSAPVPKSSGVLPPSISGIFSSTPPTNRPTKHPSNSPSFRPSFRPSSYPSITMQPSLTPSIIPSSSLTSNPSHMPSFKTSPLPSYEPSDRPSYNSSIPSMTPSGESSIFPSITKTNNPSATSLNRNETILATNSTYSLPVTNTTSLNSTLVPIGVSLNNSEPLFPLANLSAMPSSMPTSTNETTSNSTIAIPVELPSLIPSKQDDTLRNNSTETMYNETAHNSSSDIDTLSSRPSLVPSIISSNILPFGNSTRSPTVNFANSTLLPTSKVPTIVPQSHPSMTPTTKSLRKTIKPSISPSRNTTEENYNTVTMSPSYIPSHSPSNDSSSKPSNPSPTSVNDSYLVSSPPSTSSTTSSSSFTPTLASIQRSCRNHQQLGSMIENFNYDIAKSYVDISMSNNGQIIAISPAQLSNYSSGQIQVLKYHADIDEWKQYGNTIYPTSNPSTSIAAKDQKLLVSLAGGGNAIAIKVIELDDAVLKVFEYDSTTDVWKQLGTGIYYPSELLSTCSRLILSLDGRTVTCNTYDVKISSFNEQSNEWEQVGDLISTFSNVLDIDLSSDGRTVAICDHKHETASVMIYRYKKKEWEQLGEVVHTWNVSSAPKGRVSLSGDGLRIAIGLPGDVPPVALMPGEIIIYDYVQEENSLYYGWTRVFSISEADITGIFSLGEHVILSTDGQTFLFDYRKSALEPSQLHTNAVMMLRNTRRTYSDDFYEDNFDWEVSGDELLIFDHDNDQDLFSVDPNNHKISLSGDGRVVAVTTDFRDGSSREVDSAEDDDSSAIVVYQWCRYKKTPTLTPTLSPPIPMQILPSSNPSISQDEDPQLNNTSGASPLVHLTLSGLLVTISCCLVTILFQL